MISVFSADLEQGIRGTAARRLRVAPPPIIEKLCETVVNEAASEKHLYLSDPPVMSKFEGSRQTKTMVDKSTTIVNYPRDASVELGRDNLRQSQSGEVAVGKQTESLVGAAMDFPTSVLSDLSVNGTGLTSGDNTPFDGVAFFSNTHPAIGASGIQDNLLAGSGTTVANISTDMGTALSTFRTFLGTNGNPYFGDMELQIFFWYPAALEISFRTALNATIVSSTTNVLTGFGEPRSNAFLSDANDWYAFVVNPGYRPYIWQEDQPLEADAQGMDSPMWVETRKIQMGISTSIGAGYNGWQSALKFVNA